MLNHLEQFFDKLWEKVLTRRDDTAGDPSADPNLPWDSWELDPKFFKALSQWTVDHPESSLDRVLNNICDGINRGKDLLELIPDTPFPARGLVKALGCLLQLGVTVSRAKADIWEFAQEVIHWVSEMRAAFETLKGGRFTHKTKKSLKKMRALIDEICKWATARLTDGRWSRITHGLIIAKEINEFKGRIVSARALFMDISIINVSKGLDAIIEEIDKVQKMQQDQLKGIENRLDAQKQAEERQKFLSQTLFTRTVANATYDEQGKQPCDEDTREAILADIKTWVYDISNRSQSFLWLTGDPGSGKSAITASIARECKKSGILWAQFFINRNNVDTTDPKSYFPTIARQLADHLPESNIPLVIHSALKANPVLLDDISSDQASSLFVDVVDAASKLDPSKPVVIVIDGLDETKRPRLRYTADIFSKLFANLRCRNAKVFISSRTEDDIQRPFSEAFDVRHVKHIHLHTSAESSIRDVSTFLRRRIGDIVIKNDINWAVWPGEERMQALCVATSGLFIWAATVVKFFQEEIDAMGSECLDVLLDALSTNGMGDINTLYGAILHLIYKDRKDAWALETFRRIVGCIVVLREPLSLAEIEELLDLRRDSTRNRVDIQKFVRRLRTVLVTGTDAIGGGTVPRLHKSFFEFITSERADERFRVDISMSNGELAVRCLLQLARAHVGHITSQNRRSGTAVAEALSSGLGYALQFWSSHMRQDNTAMSGVAMVDSAVQLSELQQALRISPNVLNNSRPLNIALSPDRAHIVTSVDHGIDRWNRVSGQRIDGPIHGHTGVVHSQTGQPVRAPFQGHTNWVHSVAFSPDGKRIASGSSDNTIGIWDSQTGKPIGSPFQGHTNWVHSVAFSPDGMRIVSGSRDNTIRIWDSLTGKPIGSPFQGHTDCVRSVTLSPDGKRVVSSSFDRTIRIWSSQTGQPINLPLQASAVYSVALSTGGEQVVSGNYDKTIRIWDSLTGKPIGSPFQGHTGCVNSVAFSPDGKRVVSGSTDCRVLVWDPDERDFVTVSNDSVASWSLKSGLSTDRFFEGVAKDLISVTTSPDRTRLATASLDGTIYLLDVATRQLALPPITSSIDGFTSLSFSSDSSRLILAGIDGRTFVMNVADGKPMTRAGLSDGFSGKEDVVSFNLERGWKCRESDALLRWFPSDDPNVGLWAYIEGKLIRRNGPGGTSATIIDLGSVLNKRDGSV